MPFLMVRGDIAKMQTDAVVIPAAGAGQPHKIRLALCRAIMRKSFGSSAPPIIYVIVPAWTDDRNKREQLLEKANSLLSSSGRLVIAHSQSREQINSIHGGSASQVSRGLMEASQLAELMEPWFDVEEIVDDEQMYLVCGRKK